MHSMAASQQRKISLHLPVPYWGPCVPLDRPRALSSLCMHHSCGKPKAPQSKLKCLPPRRSASSVAPAANSLQQCGQHAASMQVCLHPACLGPDTCSSCIPAPKTGLLASPLLLDCSNFCRGHVNLPLKLDETINMIIMTCTLVRFKDLARCRQRH